MDLCKNEKQLDQKIDLANEDHCGSCNQYAITKSNVFRLPDAGRAQYICAPG